MTLHVLVLTVLLHSGELELMRPVVTKDPDACWEGVTMINKRMHKEVSQGGKIKKFNATCYAVVLSE